MKMKNIFKFKNIKIENQKSKSKSEYFDHLSEEDVELIRTWRNNQKRVLRQNRNIAKVDQIKYFKNVVRKETKKNKPKLILFSIKKKNNTIGYCGFVNISWINKCAEISFLLDHKLKDRKKNYKIIMLRSFNKLFKIGFKKLKFKKLFTETFIFRKDHIKILIKAGMKKEGILKNNTENQINLSIVFYMQSLDKLKNKRIFISGGAGIIGKELVKLLLDLNVKIFVGDLKKRPKEFTDEIIYRRGDLNKLKESDLKRFKPDIIFHLAASYERTEESFSFYDNNFFNNIKLSNHILRYQRILAR